MTDCWSSDWKQTTNRWYESSFFLGTLFTQNFLHFQSHWRHSSPNIIILGYERWSIAHIFQLQRLLILLHNIPGVRFPFSCYSEGTVILFVLITRKSTGSTIYCTEIFASKSNVFLMDHFIEIFTSELKTWNNQLLYIFHLSVLMFLNWMSLHYSSRSYWILKSTFLKY